MDVSKRRPLDRSGFEIAIICALPLETNAVLCSLDEKWDKAGQYYSKAVGDCNAYDYGRIGLHSVVVVTMSGMGKVNAASAAQSLRMSFSSIKLALLVGICGGVPFKSDDSEIILGDVILSENLVEFDLGRLYHGNFISKRTISDVHGRPNEEVLGLLQRWKVPALLADLQKRSWEYLNRLMQHPLVQTAYPGRKEDKLFPSNYIHRHHTHCDGCNSRGPGCDIALTASCADLQCDESSLVRRRRLNTERTPEHELPIPLIHFGTIGTSDSVMKSAQDRDKYAQSQSIIAFEMEGAGVWNKFNSLIIKGVCDYSDSHKNKKWQNYAAAVAASVAKEVLGQYVLAQRPQTEASSNILQSSPSTFRLFPSQATSPESTDGSNSLPGDWFELALSDFEEQFSNEQVETFKSTTFSSLKKLVKRIQEEQHKTKSLRNLRRMERFLVFVGDLGTFIDQDLEIPDAFAFLCGLMKLLLQKTKDRREWLDELLSTYEKLGSDLPIFSDHRDAIKDDMPQQRLLVLMFRDILEIHSRLVKLFSGNALNDVFRPFIKVFHRRFGYIRSQIRAHRRLIEDKADKVAIHAHIQDMEKRTFDFNEKENEKQGQQLNEVRDWFAGVDVEEDHYSFYHDRSRSHSRGDWILETEQVKNWLSIEPDQLPHSMLWISGRPGAGKTYLASTIIESCTESDSWVTAYFYCKEMDESRNTAVAIFRTLLLQLVRQQPELISYCHHMLKNSDSPILSAFSKAKTVFNVFCERAHRLRVIIDGIDESAPAERKLLLDAFKDMCRNFEKKAPGTFRVLILSRSVSEIKSVLQFADVLDLNAEHNRSDIQKYCRHRLGELEKFQLDDKTLQDVAHMVSSRADGIFLFAKLVMGNLAAQPNRDRFYAEITSRNVPNQLRDAYNRIMDRLKADLSSEQFSYTQLLLSWLVCSKRPLKWTEIQIALCVDLDESGTADELNMNLMLRDDVQEICGSLVQLLDGDRVEFVHSTAREYISNQSGIDIPTAECDLALRCLRYLTLNIFHPHVADEDLRDFVRRGDLGFQDYAISAWFMHIKKLVEREHNALADNSHSWAELLRNEELVTRLTRILRCFVQFYPESFPRVPGSENVYQDCSAFQAYPFYEIMVRVWSHIVSEQRKDIFSRNNVSIALLAQTLVRNRQLLESMAMEDETGLSVHYGLNIFRCSKILCFYFHEGFKSAATRDNHVNSHERPHHCPVENCSTGGMGFVSKTALTQHMRSFHPDECDLNEAFAPLNRRAVTGSRWRCTDCHKSFTRRNILIDHQRTHTGEKPFKCSVCGRGFARKNDVRRHERMRHK